MRRAIKRCMVAYATGERQHLWSVELSADATIQDAISAARMQARGEEVPWDSAPVGVFGERRARSDPAHEGDRIELYRALPSDPREGRRQRVRQARTAARRS